jgi:hypothetical protein
MVQLTGASIVKTAPMFFGLVRLPNLFVANPDPILRCKWQQTAIFLVRTAVHFAAQRSFSLRRAIGQPG